MGAITKDLQIKIENVLKEKSALSPCNACGNKELFVDGVFYNVVLNTNRLDESEDKTQAMPSVAIICKNCGSMRHHYLQTLGLLEELI